MEKTDAASLLIRFQNEMSFQALSYLHQTTIIPQMSFVMLNTIPKIEQQIRPIEIILAHQLQNHTYKAIWSFPL